MLSILILLAYGCNIEILLVFWNDSLQAQMSTLFQVTVLCSNFSILSADVVSVGLILDYFETHNRRLLALALYYMC